MKDLIAKIGRFCENHIEKIVLVIVGAVCVWLFFTRVIFSPNAVAIQGKAFAPGRIDQYVYEEKAQELSTELQGRKTAGSKVYTPRLTGAVDPCDPVIADIIDRPLPKGFAGLFESPLDFIDAAAAPKASPTVPVKYAESSRRYRLPLVPDLTDVAVNHLRAAAYVPTQELTAQSTYDEASVEPNDIDLVTVEAKFNAAELFRGFRACFNGVDVQREEWRDPCLADPTFAAVQLQRQELMDNGTWGDWKEIPRSRVERNRELFKVVERVQDLPPGGLEVRLMLFDRKDVTMDLLQPESYQIASADEEWFPPSFYGKYKDIQRRVDAEERKEQKDQERQQQDSRSTARGDTGQRGGGMYPGTQTGGRMARGGRGGTTPGGDTGMRGGRAGVGGRGGDPTMQPGGARSGRGGRRGGPGDDMYGDMMYGGMPGGGDARRRPTVNEVYFDLREQMITYEMDLSKQDKPVLVWVFDDTAEPGKTYRYRVRLGVFNPVAGTGQVVERDVDKKDQVILWSRYTEVPQAISIPKRVYLFAKNVQGKTKTATVEVARYAMGYWRTEDFDVQPGESIGKSVEPKEPERDRNRERERRLMASGQMGQMGGRITDPRMDPMGGMMGGMYAPMPTPEDASKPKVIDYTTGKVVVDLVEVSDWGDAPNLRARRYHEMLYTDDGTSIEHMPVSMTNWPSDLAQTYQAIQIEKRREPKPFKSFNKGTMRGGRGGMQGDPYGGMGMYDDMYEMGGGYR